VVVELMHHLPMIEMEVLVQVEVIQVVKVVLEMYLRQIRLKEMMVEIVVALVQDTVEVVVEVLLLLEVMQHLLQVELEEQVLQIQF
jgi:hypothetical protein